MQASHLMELRTTDLGQQTTNAPEVADATRRNIPIVTPCTTPSFSTGKGEDKNGASRMDQFSDPKQLLEEPPPLQQSLQQLHQL